MGNRCTAGYCRGKAYLYAISANISRSMITLDRIEFRVYLDSYVVSIPLLSKLFNVIFYSYQGEKASKIQIRRRV
jgi:hypothetical protein